MTEPTEYHPTLIGRFGEELTGVESRVLRAALGLERIHVAILANIADPTGRYTDVATVTNWEKSKGRGYPASLVRLLSSLNEAIERVAYGMVGPLRPDRSPETTLGRPLGGRFIHQRLDAAVGGLGLSPAELEQLDKGGGHIWQALADALMVRAALMARAKGIKVHVVLDPDADLDLPSIPNAHQAHRMLNDLLVGKRPETFLMITGEDLHLIALQQPFEPYVEYSVHTGNVERDPEHFLEGFLARARAKFAERGSTAAGLDG